MLNMILRNSINYKFNFNLFLFLLLCLVPVALVWSRFIADFFVVLICIIFIIKSLIIKNNFFNNYFFKIFLLFWFLIVFRSLFSEDLYFSLKSSLPFIRFAIFALAVQYLVQENPKRIYVLFLILLPLLFTVASDGLYQYYKGENILGYPISNFAGRLSGFFKDELIIGSYVARFTPILIGLYYYSKYLRFISSKFDYFLFIVLLFFSYLVAHSGERVSFFYSIFTLVLFLLTFEEKFYKRFCLFLITILIFSLIISKNQQISQRFIKTTFEGYAPQNQIYAHSNGEIIKEKKFIFSIDHHFHIVAAYKIFKENILFGSGAKMFRKICDKRYKINAWSCTTHPHNLIMQFLSETGILGLLFYLLSLFYILLKLFKIFKLNILDKINDFYRAQFFFLTSLLISLFPIMPSGNFFNNWIGIISFFPLGLYLATVIKKN